MADSSPNNVNKFLNPWLLNHEKLGLELKCPLCLNLLNRPVLLPCDHIFCGLCVSRSTGVVSECPVCKQQYAEQDLRPAPYMESMVSIYRKSHSTFSGGASHSTFSNTEKVPQQSPPPTNTCVDKSISSFSAGSCRRTKKRPAETERLVENNSDMAGGETNSKTSSGATDSKRRKKANYGFSHTVMKSNGCTQPNDLHSKIVATSEVESQFEKLSGEKAPTISDTRDTNRSICAFCQSSALTDRTGPMLHYNEEGEEVTGDAATKSNVTHVHKTCIEWTPQVYFSGETVKNLKEEVARAARLKCGRCGLRGAPLGCFEKSCRKSYHVPCAVEIEDCRWDVEDYLLLCPIHSSVKFPREKAQLGKHASEKQHFVATEITSKHSNFWGDSGMKKWVFCGSALSAEEKCLLVALANICGATVTKFWKPNVTHVVAATDAKGACSRTFKVLKAILHGIWVLKTDWVKACMEATHYVDEEPYEVSLDYHGCCGGPKTGRLKALDNVPKLFNGLNFYFSGDFDPAYKEDLLDLVITAGGTVNESEEQLLAPSHDAQSTPSVTLVVYNGECRQDDEGSVVFDRGEAAENLAHKMRSKVIAHTWLLDSIAAQELQPLSI